MKEWRYLVFLVKYHLNRWIREKKQGGVFYIGGSDVFPPPLKPEEELVLLEQLGGEEDVTVKAVLIERNLRLVVYIARKFENTGINVEDLISIGTIGLIKGITTFDASKGARLATYAARCVENEILMYFRSQRKSAQDVSLSDYIETGADGAPLALMDVISEDCDLLEEVSGREAVGLLRRAVERCLTEQERQVVVLRYGLGGGVPLRQRQVAEKLGISRSYISRIEKRALGKLRQALE